MIFTRTYPDSMTHNCSVRNVRLKRWFGVFAFFSLLTFWSCQQSATIENESLLGKWEVSRAMRNGNLTPYLRNGYFIIKPTGDMTINITGSDETGKYELKDNVLSFFGDRDFIIEALSKDTMDLRFVMNPDNEFLFYLKKVSHENQ